MTGAAGGQGAGQEIRGSGAPGRPLGIAKGRSWASASSFIP